MFDWSDIHVFLTVQRSGSFTSAARALRVDQTTVGRRVASLEAALGVKLFRRGRDGLALTAAGHEVRHLAKQMESAALTLDRSVRGRDRVPGGPVRLTTLESFASRFLAPRLGEFRKAYPAILLDLHTDNRSLSLSRREADVAVRMAKPSQAGLVARKLGSIAYAVYAAPSYVAARGRPDAAAELASHDVAGFDEDLSSTPEARWLAEHGVASPALRTNSVAVLEAAAKVGAGLAVLPCYIGDARDDLVRVVPPERVLERELWLVVHAELRSHAAVRAVADFVTEAVTAARGALTGRVPHARRRARSS